jgi:hypothetical protein
MLSSEDRGLPKRLNSLFTEEAGASLVNIEVGRVWTSLFHRAVGPTDHAAEEQGKDNTAPFLLSRGLPKKDANGKDIASSHCHNEARRVKVWSQG